MIYFDLFVLVFAAGNAILAYIEINDRATVGWAACGVVAMVHLLIAA